jgi:ferredoxin
VRVWIEAGRCTGAGLCELIEHQVFTLGEDGLSRVMQDGRALPPGAEHAAEIADSYADRVREASRACPGDCIRFQIGSEPAMPA